MPRSRSWGALTLGAALLIPAPVLAQTMHSIDFSNDAVNAAWKAERDQGARLDISFPPADDNAAAGRHLRIDFDNIYAASVQLSAQDVPAGTIPKDLTQFGAVALRTWSLNDDTSIRVMVQDARGVQYSCRRRVRAGWTESVVYPLREMFWFTYCPVRGPIDWTDIALIAIEPSDYSESGAIGIGKITFVPAAAMGPPEPAATPPPIRVNTLGYYPGGPKLAVIADCPADRFEVIDQAGAVVAKGATQDLGIWKDSGERLRHADFSSVTAPGEYRLRAMRGEEVLAVSDPLVVRAGVYRDLLRSAVRGYSLQRCSTALSESYFGIYARPAAHPDNACRLMPSTGREGAVDVSGGWYDAGDYGKYVVNAGVTLGTLQLARQWYPDAVGDDLGIPETGNGTSDLGDEIAWELAWLAKMQDPTDGGAFFKVGSPKWDGFVPPSQTKYERVVFGKSTTSTLHFAAVMAQAATSGIADAATSGTWLRQARRAWDWAIAHPAVSHPTEESGTGPYDDTNYDDEFLWAAAELALATDEPAYWEQVRSRMAEVPAESPPQWQNVAALAWLDLAVSARPVPQDVRSEAQRGVLELAQRGLDSEARSPYRLPLDRFFWGSTSDQLNWGVVFAAAHRLSGEARWRDAACQTADYVLGRNAVGRSFVTGFGQRPPRHLHHRVILGSRYSEPFQGLLVGGPNAGIEDDVRKDPTGVLYPDVPPARQYMDHRDAAGTNEICINWNAPLVLVLSFLEATSP